MKKRILAVLMASALVGSLLAGCGKESDVKDNDVHYEEDNDSSSSETSDLNIESGAIPEDNVLAEVIESGAAYVTLSEYKNVVEIADEDREITDEDVEQALQSYLESYQDYSCEHIEGTVDENSRLGISYYITNDIDGKQEYPEQVIRIGEYVIIPGLDESLIGKSTGDTFKYETTYPDDWWNQELVGKQATVEGTILYILGEPAYKELSDEFIVELTGGQYTSVDEFRTVQKNQLESYTKMNYGYEALLYVIENSKYSDIDSLVKEEAEYNINSAKIAMAAYAEESGQKLYELYGYSSEEEYNEWLTVNAESYVKEIICVNALSKELNLELTDDDISEYINQIGGYYDSEGVNEMANDKNVQYSILKEKVVNALYDLQ